MRVYKSLVLVTVTVIDSMGRFVSGLDRRHFKVIEEKVEQQISDFTFEDARISAGLVFDVSRSMRSRITQARQAAAQFLSTANTQDEFFLILFSDRSELAVPFTSSAEEIQTRLALTQPQGRTALLDAVRLATHRMKTAHHSRKALLIVSDGNDNASRYTGRDIKSMVREADIQIYAISISGPVSVPGGAGLNLLSELTELTGGRHFRLKNVAEAPDVAAKIGMELRNSYTLGYTPLNLKRDGRYRRLQVKLDPPLGLSRLNAYYRRGYYAPIQ